MGSVGDDVWVRCAVCDRWETDCYFPDCDFAGGVVCPRCFFHAPPHFEYLRGVFRPTFSREITDRVATFAYECCAPQEEADSLREADSQFEDEPDDVITCPVCDLEWFGWYCRFCSLTVGE